MSNLIQAWSHIYIFLLYILFFLSVILCVLISINFLIWICFRYSLIRPGTFLFLLFIYSYYLFISPVLTIENLLITIPGLLKKKQNEFLALIQVFYMNSLVSEYYSNYTFCRSVWHKWRLSWWHLSLVSTNLKQNLAR